MIKKNQAGILARLIESMRVVAAGGDDERAHGMEKGVWDRALREISKDSTDPLAKELATLALSTQETQFQRWTA